MIYWLICKWECFRYGHFAWRKVGETVGGDVVRCVRCNALEEYLPGVHEPKSEVPYDGLEFKK